MTEDRITRHSGQERNLPLSEKSAVPPSEVLEPLSLGIDEDRLRSEAARLLAECRRQLPENHARIQGNQLALVIRIIGALHELSLLQNEAP